MTKVKDKKSLPLPEKHQVLVDCIRVGKQNSTVLKDIMILADIQEKRQAYIIIEELINKYGFVIGASRTGEHKGYYKPANEREFDEVARTFKSSIDSMDKRYFSLLENYRNLSEKRGSVVHDSIRYTRKGS